MLSRGVTAVAAAILLAVSGGSAVAQSRADTLRDALLGGRRKPERDSRNTYWENDQFRAYADYMATPEFAAAVDRLLQGGPTAYMCAEAVPWRCHRNLLSDELVRRGIEVVHIVGPGKAQPHELNKAARAAGDHLVYEHEQRGLGF